MDYKKKIIIGLVFLIFISVSTVSASENATIMDESNDEAITEYMDDDNAYGNFDVPVEATITAKDVQTYYLSDKEIPVTVKDMYGYPINCIKVIAKYPNGAEYEEYTDDSGKAYFYPMPIMGTHATYFSLDDENYFASPIKINVKITKAPVYVSAKKVTTTTNKYATLKATVEDRWGDKVLEGKVKFTVNGKSYTVKVKNGVATKKIKLNKAKTYKYKASYWGKYYKSKSASSKVIVKKPVKTYTIRKEGYSFKVSESQYKKIKYVKNHQDSQHLSTYANFKVKTNYDYFGDPVYAIVTTWSGIEKGHYYNYPQVQFVVMHGSNTGDWVYLTGRCKI